MRHCRRLPVLAAMVFATACATREPDPALSADWASALVEVSEREQVDPLVRSRLAAYASVAHYEAHAADPTAGLRSMGGQLNGLWATPVPPAEAPVDGATAAAEATRLVLDSLVGDGHEGARRTFDSLATAHVEQRRRDRVRDEQIERSVAHGRAVAAAVIAWAGGDGLASGTVARRARSLEERWGSLRPSVLRSPSECIQAALPAYSARSSAQVWQDARALHDSARRAREANGAEAQSRAAVDADTPLRWVTTAEPEGESLRAQTSRLVEVTTLVALAAADARISAARDAQTRTRNRFPAEGAVTAAAAAGVLAGLRPDAAAGASVEALRVASEQSAARAAAVFASVGVQQAAFALRGAAHGQCIADRVIGRVRTRP